MAEPVASLRAQLSLDSATFERGAKRAQQSMTQLRGSASRLGGSFSGLNRALASNATRNVSLQLSQVAQQASATGNFIQALAIQLPDLTLAFGPLGIAAGVVAGALLPMAANLFGVSEGARDFDQRMDQLNNTLERYISTTEQIAADGKLHERFGRNTAAAREFLKEIANIERANLQQEIEGALGEMTDPFGLQDTLAGLQLGRVADEIGLERSFSVFTQKARDARDEIDAIAQTGIDASNRLFNAVASGDLDRQVEAAENMLRVYTDLADADGQRTDAENQYIQSLTEVVLKMQQLQSVTLDVAGATEQIAAGYRAVAGAQTTLDQQTEQYLQKTAASFRSTSSLRDTIGEAAFEALRLAGVDMSAPISQSTLEAGELAARLGSSVEEAIALQNQPMSAQILDAAAAAQALSSELGVSLRTAMALQGMLSDRPSADVFDTRDGRYNSAEFRTERTRRTMESGELLRSAIVPSSMREPTKRRRSGGGGGGTSAAEREMNEMLRERDRILESLKTEQDKYNDALAQADRLLKAGVLTSEDYAA